MQIQAAGSTLRLLPCAPVPAARLVTTRARTTVRIDCRQGEIGEVETGNHTASVVDGAIVIGGVPGEVG